MTSIVFAFYAYIALTVLTWGTLNALVQNDVLSEYYDRTDWAITLGLSLIPITWIIAPFISGFWLYGWTISPSRRWPKQ